MPIFQSGAYRVKTAAVDKTKRATRTLSNTSRPASPGRRCISPGSTDDPTQFIHLFIFADAAA
jgi:hypothetical protein